MIHGNSATRQWPTRKGDSDAIDCLLASDVDDSLATTRNWGCTGLDYGGPSAVVSVSGQFAGR